MSVSVAFDTATFLPVCSSQERANPTKSKWYQCFSLFSSKMANRPTYFQFGVLAPGSKPTADSGTKRQPSQRIAKAWSRSTPPLRFQRDFTTSNGQDPRSSLNLKSCSRVSQHEGASCVWRLAKEMSTIFHHSDHIPVSALSDFSILRQKIQECPFRTEGVPRFFRVL